MVEHVLAKDETRVRFSLAAQNFLSFNKGFIHKQIKETVDNYVGIVDKGQPINVHLGHLFD